MSKLICDICGTSYSDTEHICPTCGLARAFEEPDPAPEQAAVVRERIKGGRFSKKNVEKRLKEQARKQAETPAPAPVLPEPRELAAQMGQAMAAAQAKEQEIPAADIPVVPAEITAGEAAEERIAEALAETIAEKAAEEEIAEIPAEAAAEEAAEVAEAPAEEAEIAEISAETIAEQAAEEEITEAPVEAAAEQAAEEEITEAPVEAAEEQEVEETIDELPAESTAEEETEQEAAEFPAEDTEAEAPAEEIIEAAAVPVAEEAAEQSEIPAQQPDPEMAETEETQIPPETPAGTAEEAARKKKKGLLLNIALGVSLTAFILSALYLIVHFALPYLRNIEWPTQAVVETTVPTDEPTEALTEEPTDLPTEAPTAAPTDPPTEASTKALLDVELALNYYDLTFGAATQTTQLNASGIPNEDVTWISDDPGVVTISDTGLITAVGGGKTTIHAIYGDQEVTVKINCRF